VAIAFRSIGARSKVDTSAFPGPVSVALPSGHTSGDLLLMFVITDTTTNSNDPSGWTRLAYITNGTSTQTPYAPRLQAKIFWRIDNGALGSSVSLTFDTTHAWPTGKPSVLAYCMAYSGCDGAGPIERWAFLSTTSTATAMTHPQLTTSSANDWLVTWRAVSSDAPGATFTDSVGTDVERQDDIDAITEIACATYDSNTALTAGVQTQRTTTASRAATYGGLAVSIALKPPGTTAVFANAQSAEAIATALDATATAQNGSWDFCGTGGLPDYTFSIDWSSDGYFADSVHLGATSATDAFGRSVSNAWGTADTGQSWTQTGGAASEYSVGSGVGTMAVAALNTSRIMTMTAPSADVDLQSDFATSVLATGGSHYAAVVARYTDVNNYYMIRAQVGTDQTIILSLRRRIAGVEVELASAPTGLTHAAGTYFTLRMRILGSVLWAKAWPVGSAEPDWMLSAADTGITVKGSMGVRSILDAANSNTLPVSFTFDNFRASLTVNDDDVTGKIVSDVSIQYGRDQNRELNPASVGTASYSLVNVDRTFSPDFSTSALFGDLEPSRPAQGEVVFNGNTYPLFTGRVDDYTVKADIGDRNVDFTFLDGMNDLQNTELSTGVYASLRTGDLVNVILDLAGWTGPRDIDLGATVVKYWWVEGVNALDAINDLVKSEGPPAIAYQAPDGTFVFRDRHHRLIRSQSTTSQAAFYQPRLMDCTVAPPDPSSDAFDFTGPFTYTHGARDIVNSVSFDVSERNADTARTPVWTSDDTLSLAIGQSAVIEFSGNDPFIDALTPVAGTDFVTAGAGTVQATLSRTSGASATLSLLAIGGSVNIIGLQVRARAIPVVKTTKVSRVDTGSISAHGERSYPDDAPWANANDADAIAGMILLQYAKRRPTVMLRVTAQDPAHFVQAITRTVSDRIHITYDEMGLDSDFFVESVQHTIQRLNQAGKPPVHAVVLGCEKDIDTSSNPFRFDVRGAGFDQGVFDPIQADGADTVFIFDHPTQGQFDFGQFGT
jgi:hypothetical protein